MKIVIPALIAIIPIGFVIIYDSAQRQEIEALKAKMSRQAEAALLANTEARKQLRDELRADIHALCVDAGIKSVACNRVKSNRQ